MAVTEEGRRRLYDWAERSGDKEVAAALMELLPPVGWADVATKRDVDSLEERFGLRLDLGLHQVRQEMHEGFADMHREMRVQLYWLLGFLIAVQGAFAALAQTS